MLMNSAKCQGCSFYHFWVIKGKPTGEGGIKWAPSHTHTHPDKVKAIYIYAFERSHHALSKNCIVYYAMIYCFGDIRVWGR